MPLLLLEHAEAVPFVVERECGLHLLLVAAELHIIPDHAIHELLLILLVLGEAPLRLQELLLVEGLRGALQQRLDRCLELLCFFKEFRGLALVALDCGLMLLGVVSRLLLKGLELGEVFRLHVGKDI